MTNAPFTVSPKNASNSKQMADTAVSCLRTYGINVVRKKQERSKSMSLSSGKTTIDFSYTGVKKLNVDLLEEIVRIFDTANIRDVKTATITDSTIFFKELIFSDLQANQQRVLAHFEFFDISIGYVASDISVYEIVNDFNDRHITTTQGEKKMAKDTTRASSSITIESLGRGWLADFIKKFADKKSIKPTLDYSELPKHSLDRYKLAALFQEHWSYLKGDQINNIALSRRLTQILVSDKDDAEAILVRVNHPKGSYMGARLGQKGLAILKSHMEISRLNTKSIQTNVTNVTHESSALTEENKVPTDVVLAPETNNISVADAINLSKSLKITADVGREASSKLNLLDELAQCNTEVERLQGLLETTRNRIQEIEKLSIEPVELLTIKVLEGKEAESGLFEIALNAEYN